MFSQVVWVLLHRRLVDNTPRPLALMCSPTQKWSHPGLQSQSLAYHLAQWLHRSSFLSQIKELGLHFWVRDLQVDKDQ
jgi:hypothetical protein